MPNTLKRAYRYPGQNDEPDVPLRIQQLAEDVDADVDALSVRTSPSSAVVAPHADFDVTAAGTMTVSKQGSLAVLNGRVFRKAGKTTTVVGYLPAAYWPKNVVHGAIVSRVGTTGSTGPSFHVFINPPDGSIGLTLIGGAAWSEIHWLPLNFTFELATP